MLSYFILPLQKHLLQLNTYSKTSYNSDTSLRFVRNECII